jgi:hypothetical protein
MSDCLLTKCREYVENCGASRAEISSLVIRAAWKSQYALRLTPDDFPVLREYVVIQTVGFGSCHEEVTDLSLLRADCIGRSALDVAQFPLPYRVASLDAIASDFVPSPSAEYRLEGSNALKLAMRSDLITEETLRLASGISSRRARVVVVGALGSLLARLVSRPELDVYAVDGNVAVIGKNYHGVFVESSSLTLDLMRNADISIVTGMALANGTIDEILRTAIAAKSRLLMFLQTGANLVVPYLEENVDTVVSEPYPFYFMGPGATVVRVFRRA